MKVSTEFVARSKASGRTAAATEAFDCFSVPPDLHPPSATPAKTTTIAQDNAISPVSNWAAGAYASAFPIGIGGENLHFLGFPYLAALAQRPEIRKIVEIIATESTRRWIKIVAKGEDEDKTEKIAVIEAAFERLKARDRFRECLEHDGYFGRGHIYLDIKGSDVDGERESDIGTGLSGASKNKLRKGCLLGIRTVEPVWIYPQQYNTTDPTAADWYKPQIWAIQSKKVHTSRILTITSREVPDILKPAYSFGGLPLTQMVKPYVDNFLRNRQSVSDLIRAFSIMVFSTDMTDALNGGDGQNFMNRLASFVAGRDNLGAFAVDKEREDLKNVSAPLGGLDHLVAQSQEQIASIASIPLVKYLGITPSGLNASSDGEIRVFYDFIHAGQEANLGLAIDKLLAVVQLSEFGEVDPDITYTFEPLWNLSELELAQVQQVQAATATSHLQNGTITAEEERRRIANDVDSPYQGLDPDEMPPPPRGEMDEGGEPPAPGQEAVAAADFAIVPKDPDAWYLQRLSTDVLDCLQEALGKAMDESDPLRVWLLGVLKARAEGACPPGSIADLA